MARSMGGGSRGGGRSSGGRSGAGRSMGSSRSGTSRAFGSGHSGGNASRGSGRSYSGQTSSGNPMMGGFGGSGGFGGPHGGPGFHNPPPPRHYHHHHYGYGYGYGRRHYNNNVYVHHSSGCSSVFAFIILLIIVMSVISSRSMYRRNNNMYYNYTAPSYSDSYSNVERTKFNGKVNLNGYYSDPDGLLYDDEIKPLEKGLQHFYNTTGVCAYVYFVEELDPDVDGTDYAADLYDELFSDEGHILLLYDYMNAYMYDAQGYEIGTTIDSEAVDIIYDYVEAQWSKDSENLGNIFGEGCAMAADRMMYKERSFAEKYKTIIIVVIVSVVAIIILSLLFKWWKAKTAQKNKEQEDLERTLKTPLESFGDTKMDDLKKKYDDTSSGDSQ